MLVLSRKVGDTIVINEEITVVIKHVSTNGRVSVGIIAPDLIPIRRGELELEPPATETTN